MKRIILIASLSILALSAVIIAPPASAQIRINANLGTGQVWFDTEPNMTLVPGTQVYYAPYGNYEVYRYHNRWFANREGTWYRASSYDGPYVPVDYDRVPPQVVAVPMEYRQQYNQGWQYDNSRSYWMHHRHHHRDYNDNNTYDNNDNYRH
jgi:hypothetical protein